MRHHTGLIRIADHPVNRIEELLALDLAAALVLLRFIRIQKSMPRVPVDSSSIASIGYAQEQHVLERNLEKVERSINTSMCPPRSTPHSSPPIPKERT